MAFLTHFLFAICILIAFHWLDPTYSSFVAVALVAMLQIQGTSLIMGLTRRLWLHVPVLTAISILLYHHAVATFALGQGLALTLAFIGVILASFMMSLILVNIHGAVLLVGFFATLIVTGAFLPDSINASDFPQDSLFHLALVGFVILAFIERKIRRSSVASFLWYLGQDTSGWMQRKQEAALNRRLVVLTSLNAYLASLVIIFQLSADHHDTFLSVPGFIVVLTCVVLGGYGQSALAVICMVPLILLPEIAIYFSPETVDTRLVLAAAGLILVLPRSFRASIAEDFARSLLESRPLRSVDADANGIAPPTSTTASQERSA